VRGFIVHLSRRLRIALLAALLATALRPGPAWADSQAAEAGIGTAAALTTLVYGPTKVVYATLGLVIGGIAWGLSGGDGAVMDAIITPAVRGDYVVTPEQLRGERGLEFFGRDPAYRPQADVVADGY
jgi:hypothetical protein